MDLNEKLSIKINIAGRVYPLTIIAKEEENIRKAAKLLNDRMKSYEENFSVKDTQDLLAMCALEFSVKALVPESKSESSYSEHQILEALSETERFLNQYLNK